MMALLTQGQFEGRFLDLLQKFVTANLTGRLSLRFAQSKAEIFIRTGWVIHAALDQSSGQEALVQCLGQEALVQCLEVEFGDYQFEPGIESDTRTITDSFSRIAVSYSRGRSGHATHTSGEMTITAENNNQSTTKPINSNILAGLQKIATEALGPAGILILEDAAADLGWELVAVPQGELGGLIQSFKQQITDTNSLARLEQALKRIGL